MFIFPIGHEQSIVRRWPVVTIGIIVACLLVHTVVFQIIERQQSEIEQIEAQIARVKAELFVKYAAAGGSNFLDLMEQSDARNMLDLALAMGARMDLFIEEFRAGRVVEEDHLDYRRLRNLELELTQTQERSVIKQFAFRPDEKKPHTYITALFLHGGLLHLLGNLYFLYLVGGAIEDRWGRIFFLIFYLAGGAVSLITHSYFFLDPAEPVIGASGAIAAVMGAFCVRFWKVKIHFWYFFWILKLKTGVFSLPAWIVLLCWFAMQLFYGIWFDEVSPVAFMAHAGGFAFGLIVAGIVKLSGLEQKNIEPMIEKRIDTKVYRTDPLLLRSNQLITEGRPEQGLELLYQQLAKQPGDLTIKREILRAFLALKRTAEVKVEGKEVIGQLIDAERIDEAAGVFQEICEQVDDFSPDPQPAFLLARYFEENSSPKDALAAYRNLAIRWPEFPLAPKSLIAASRLAHEKLDEPEAAFRLLRRFLEKYPDDPLADHVKNEIRRITDGQTVFD